MNVVLVSGPPCSGKTTWAHAQAEPDDLILDFDDVYEAVAGVRYDDRPDALVALALAAFREQLMELALRRSEPGQAWVVSTSPRRWQRERYRSTLEAWRSVVLLVAPELALDRAAAERPSAWRAFVEKWFAEYQPDPFDEALTWDGERFTLPELVVEP